MLQTLKSLRWGDYFILALTDPRGLYRLIARNEPKHLALGFSVPAAAAIAEIIAASLLGAQGTFFYYKITYGWVLLFLYTVTRWIVSAALMDLAAQFWGYRGNIKEMISVVNYSLVPMLLILPVVTIFTVIPFATVFFCVSGWICLAVWSAAIAAQGISEMHECSFGRALFIYLFPAIFTGAAVFFILFLGLICLGGLISS